MRTAASSKAEQPRWDADTQSRVDADQPTSIQTAVDHTASEFGRLDGVVNCIGSVLLKPAHMTSDAEWDETIATNLTSSFHALRAAAPRMRTTGGSLVFGITPAKTAEIAMSTLRLKCKSAIVRIEAI